MWAAARSGYGPAVGSTLLLTIVAVSIVSTVLLLGLALAVPAGAHHDLGGRDGRFPDTADDGRPRVRLLSRLLFTRTQDDAITIDCLLMAVEKAGPGVDAPEGLPFTLQLRTPDTAWFADRVEQLLEQWAEESRELLVELREDHGKVRTMIASGASTVHLELAGAAGLTLA